MMWSYLGSGNYMTFFEIGLSLSPFPASATGKSGEVTGLWDGSSLCYGSTTLREGLVRTRDGRQSHFYTVHKLEASSRSLTFNEQQLSRQWLFNITPFHQCFVLHSSDHQLQLLIHCPYKGIPKGPLETLIPNISRLWSLKMVLHV